jgi:uncharacterized protein (DUF2141 family)
MKRMTLIVLASLLLSPTLAEARLAKLTIIVRGIEPATGSIEVSLFNSAETFMRKAKLQRALAVDGKHELTIEFAALQEGEYAVVVVHDENGNGVLDTGFLGFGGEQFAFSNNARSWFLQPGFDAAKFTMGKEDREIVVDLD